MRQRGGALGRIGSKTMSFRQCMRLRDVASSAPRPRGRVRKRLSCRSKRVAVIVLVRRHTRQVQQAVHPRRVHIARARRGSTRRRPARQRMPSVGQRARPAAAVRLVERDGVRPRPVRIATSAPPVAAATLHVVDKRAERAQRLAVDAVGASAVGGGALRASAVQNLDQVEERLGCARARARERERKTERRGRGARGPGG